MLSRTFLRSANIGVNSSAIASLICSQLQLQSRSVSKIAVVSSSPAGPFRITRTLLAQRKEVDEATARVETDLTEVHVEEGQQHQNGDAVTDFDPEAAAGAEEGQSFDMVEATLQEVHDLVVAMLQHKAMTRPGAPAKYEEEDTPTYRSMRDWERGHKLFAEWLDKLEQLLTKDTMAAMLRNAAWSARDPGVRSAQEASATVQKMKALAPGEELSEEDASKHDPRTHQGFRRHPLHCPSAGGSNRVVDKELAAHRTLYAQRHTTDALSRFFTHTPYAMQISRPDVSPEILAQTRAYRDRHTLDALHDLCRMPHKRVEKRLPADDVRRIIQLVSNATGYEGDQQQ